MVSLFALTVAAVSVGVSAFQQFQQGLASEFLKRNQQAESSKTSRRRGSPVSPADEDADPEPRHLRTRKAQDDEEAWPFDQIFGRDEVPDYSSRQRMYPEDALSLYQSMHVVNTLFRVRNITYWAGGGTLLGAMRNKGVIPHDNDIDIHIPKEDTEKLLSDEFKADLERNDLKLIAKDPGQWGITNKSLRSAPLKHGLKTKRGLVKSKEPPYAFWIDVYLMYLSGADDADGGRWKFEHKDKFYRPRAFTGNVTDFPFMKLPFGDTFVYAPQEDITNSYVAKIYGSDWNTTVNCHGTHHSCRLANESEWALRHCAEPTGPLRDAKLSTAEQAAEEGSRRRRRRISAL